jgi:hypothetical protein
LIRERKTTMTSQLIGHRNTPVGGRMCGSGNALDRVRWLLSGDVGMSTAEYAIGTVAAAAFAALLYSVITGGSLTGALTSLIQRALESSL